MATSVPEPIATPMLARRRAGASLTPSPVTATKWPSRSRASTISSFWSGATRAKTNAWPTVSMYSGTSGEPMASSSAPVVTSSSPPAIPRVRAIASAVPGWSPVTITTRIPAAWHSATASAASGRTGSMNAARPSRVSGGSSSHQTPGSSPSATASTR